MVNRSLRTVHVNGYSAATNTHRAYHSLIADACLLIRQRAQQHFITRRYRLKSIDISLPEVVNNTPLVTVYATYYKAIKRGTLESPLSQNFRKNYSWLTDSTTYRRLESLFVKTLDSLNQKERERLLLFVSSKNDPATIFALIVCGIIIDRAKREGPPVGLSPEFAAAIDKSQTESVENNARREEEEWRNVGYPKMQAELASAAKIKAQEGLNLAIDAVEEGLEARQRDYWAAADAVSASCLAKQSSSVINEKVFELARHIAPDVVRARADAGKIISRHESLRTTKTLASDSYITAIEKSHNSSADALDAARTVLPTKGKSNRAVQNRLEACAADERRAADLVEGSIRVQYEHKFSPFLLGERNKSSAKKDAYLCVAKVEADKEACNMALDKLRGGAPVLLERPFGTTLQIFAPNRPSDDVLAIVKVSDPGLVASIKNRESLIINKDFGPAPFTTHHLQCDYVEAYRGAAGHLSAPSDGAVKSALLGRAAESELHANQITAESGKNFSDILEHSLVAPAAKATPECKVSEAANSWAMEIIKTAAIKKAAKGKPESSASSTSPAKQDSSASNFISCEDISPFYDRVAPTIEGTLASLTYGWPTVLWYIWNILRILYGDYNYFPWLTSYLYRAELKLEHLVATYWRTRK